MQLLQKILERIKKRDQPIQEKIKIAVANAYSIRIEKEVNKGKWLLYDYVNIELHQISIYQKVIC